MQLQWHKTHWKDATLGWCKQGRSWHIKKHSCPISQTYRTCNALLKLAKDTSLGVRNKGSWRKHILPAIGECQKMHPHWWQIQCLGLLWCRKRARTSDWRTWPQRPWMPLQCSSWVPALAAALQVTANVTRRNLASTCTSAQHRGHGRPVLLWMSGWSYLENLKILWSQIQGFLNLLLQISNHQKCLQAWQLQGLSLV